MSKDTEYGPLEEGVSMTQEVSRKNRKNRDVPGHGWYKHPLSGQRVIVQDDPLWGNTQAQAAVQVGFVFERPATADEVKTLPELAMDARNAEEGNLKGLSARLDRLENVAEDNKSLTNEVAELRKKLADAEAEKAEAVKAAKAQAKSAKETSDHISDAGKASTPNAQEQSAKGAKENAEQVQSEREQATGQSQNATLKTPEEDAQTRSEEEQKAKAEAEKTSDDSKTKEEGKGK